MTEAEAKAQLVAEAKAQLVAEARALGVSGVLENMKPETLKKKIAEANAKLSDASVGVNGGLRKLAKFNKG